MRPKQVATTPAIAKCARCGANATCIDWNYRDLWCVMCDKNHTSTRECGTIHRAICRWNNAQARIHADAMEAPTDAR